MAYVELFSLVGIICGLIYYWCKHNYSYWPRNGIPQDEPTPLIGNIKPFLTMKVNFGLHLSNIYKDKRFENKPVVGIYVLNRPGLIIRDLGLVKSILIKDFNKFNNRYSTADPHGDALASNNLFFMKNPQWKEMRTKLSPVFTSGKIKQMYPLMLEIANDLETYLDGCFGKSKTNYFSDEVKDICAHFTTDLIATIAFGIRPNSLADPQNEFRTVCRRLFEFDWTRAKDIFVIFFLPKLVETLRVKFFTKEFSVFVRRAMHHVMEEREKSGHQRNDLIDVLVALKKQTLSESNQIELQPKDSDFLLAQGAVFLAAGFETSSSTMAFALYELAKHPEMQQRLREEICEALVVGNGSVSYETLTSLEYLGMVIDEILRLYPVLPFLDREYTHAEGEKEYTLEPHYKYKLPKGMPIYIPIFGIQRDPQYWEDPDTFNPERFSNENKKNINPMTYLPFGTGPHLCLGNRIGPLQSKIGLVHFLKNHSVSACEKTIKDIKFDPKAFILQTVGGIYLKITRDGMYDHRVQAS